MRLVWRVIGVGAAVLCTLNALFLVGFSLSELVSRSSIASTPWRTRRRVRRAGAATDVAAGRL